MIAVAGHRRYIVDGLVVVVGSLKVRLNKGLPKNRRRHCRPGLDYVD